MSDDKFSKLSSDAHMVAGGLFMMGAPMLLSFKRPHIIHPRTLAALNELSEAGLLADAPDEVQKGGKAWRALPEMGRPISWAKMTGESWPVTTE